METELNIQDAAGAIISFTDSYAYKKERKQKEQPESESTDSLIEITAYLEYLGDKIRNNNDFKQMIMNQNLLRPLASLTIFKLGNHSNQEVDQLRLNVRYNSRTWLGRIQYTGDAQDFADLVNVGYGKVICISFSTAGGIGEEEDEEIWNRLVYISEFLRELHQEEQIEEEGAKEEVDAQMNNNGYHGYIKHCANQAKVATLCSFCHRG
ncbi:MAG: hypothetical protein EZS28_014138 [Streblomastix strix]|uniref:Uncharacterized protein n=1 Tax=Streblomastix strix TaxID=222440 RepID=A0A5J4W5Z0_9EUKA|nr:MAG: hypothetical protein EZS28_014138 [Streblomastix strix]